MTDARPAPIPGLPAGARDVLPTEAGELRDLGERLRLAFAEFGYREVATPILEYAASAGGDGVRQFRLFDENGDVLVLRPDLTMPVSRLVATRLADHPGPVRAWYLGPVFRPPPPGRPRRSQVLQAGVELVGARDPGADAEVIGLLGHALERAGVPDARIAVGDVRLTAEVLDALGVATDRRVRLAGVARARDLAGWEAAAVDAGADAAASALIGRLLSIRGDASALDEIARLAPSAAGACEHLARVLALAERHGLGGRVTIDLSVQREPGYYSGVVFEAFTPHVGVPVAMGGRYDGLTARYGRPRPAVGFAIAVDDLHRALANAGMVSAGPRLGVVLVDGLDAELAIAAEARRAGLAVIATAGDFAAGRALAQADGWRYVAEAVADGIDVLDLTTDRRRTCARLADLLGAGGPG